ncbi:MAG TPA: hypothetical protein VND91_11745 [Candidatus Saccharimonadia bacterium]|nr:hypothetical protein [Candidatus Saccharimonadia bacterium]
MGQIRLFVATMLLLAARDGVPFTESGGAGSLAAPYAADVIGATPTLATSASPNITLGAGTLSDTATVTGLIAPQSSATVEFRLYGPGDASCIAPPVFVSAARPITAGGVASSTAFTPAASGTYRWRAFYSGDPNNAPVNGACNAPNESVVVNPAAPTISTSASAGVVLGGSVFDTASVTGRINALPSATIDFRLYGPLDASCSGTPVFESLGRPQPIADGPVTSASFTPTQAGTYRWRAFYSGDPNNFATSGPCNAAAESVVVTAPDALFLDGFE